MQIKSNISTKLEDIYYFILYLGNISNKFTRNELRLLAKIMVLHPKQLSYETRSTIMEEMGIKKAYLSQLTNSLLGKNTLAKQGHNLELSSEKYKMLAEKIKKDRSLDIEYHLTTKDD